MQDEKGRKLFVPLFVLHVGLRPASVELLTFLDRSQSIAVRMV